MGPASFVIAILGCADGGSACTQVATLQAHYSSEAQCAAAAGAALIENSNFDFPTLVARCRPEEAKSAEAKSAETKSADAQEPPREKRRRG